jgi:hypothetical protein
VRRSLAIRANIPWQLQRRILRPELRRKIATALAARQPAPAGCQEDIVDLDLYGQHLLPGYLSQDRIEEFRAGLASLTVTDRYRPDLGSFDADRPPAVTHVADYDLGALLKLPITLRIANDPKILGIVGQYLGCKPTISNILAWWSYPGHAEPEEAESFHRDVDEWRFLKLFVYLTDVDPGSGPHCYVRGSARSNRLTRLQRYSDDEVGRAFDRASVEQMTGRAGDAFLEDTFGLHKGQLCAAGPRLIFQVQYSIGPVRIYDYDTKVALPAGMDAHINRLYCT